MVFTVGNSARKTLGKCSDRALGKTLVKCRVRAHGKTVEKRSGEQAIHWYFPGAG